MERLETGDPEQSAAEYKRGALTSNMNERGQMVDQHPNDQARQLAILWHLWCHWQTCGHDKGHPANYQTPCSALAMPVLSRVDCSRQVSLASEACPHHKLMSLLTHCCLQGMRWYQQLPTSSAAHTLKVRTRCSVGAQ